jgi:glyoxylase-like metal-dependent hydrolase (beta-lactamase superfamily II)
MNPPAKSFASSQDWIQRQGSVERLAEDVYAYTTQGDPNTGFIAGPESVLAIDARATPALAREFLDAIRGITPKPVTRLVLTHYHAVRVLGASAFGKIEIIAHRGTRELILERGAQDFASETARFPRLFRDVESVPGLTMPSVTFDREMTIYLGSREVQLRFLGRGHTSGDTAIWLPRERILFAGDLVEAGAAPYAGDAYFGDWLATLDRVSELDAAVLVPGRGPAVRGEGVAAAIQATGRYLRLLRDAVAESIRREATLKQAFDAAYAALAPEFSSWSIFEHCIPFNVSRAYDELSGTRPRIWTAARDRRMWDQLQG